MKLQSMSAILLCVFASACSAEGADGLEPQDDATLRSRLEKPTTLVIDSAASLVAATAHTDQDGDAMPIEFSIVDGRVDLIAQPSGEIVVHEFELDLGDVTVSADFLPPNGLELRELKVRMDYPVVAEPEWSEDGTAASGDVMMSITADWSAVFNDNVYSLRSIVLPELLVHAHLALSGNTVLAQVSAVKSGTFWNWAGKFQMSDLVVEVDTLSD